MALSQVQCLENNHVNLRTNESKPEFFYSENQRLALEFLINNGRDAFGKFIKRHNVQDFLSDMEFDHLTSAVEVYNPSPDVSNSKLSRESDEKELSLQYWPDLSDYSLPHMDMGWPDCASYRGVTRAHVYVQPPMEGEAHIKEIVRKTIAQAQKVIAIVMDLFTDVDIFKDLLDAGFKRKVAVYIILEATGVPHFIKMCDRAGMHTGHLKNLRVRSTRGTEFFTRSSKKVCGSQSQKFMFVDGDRAVSGSYSFTWTASRLDRNVITLLTGQVVDTFDKLFQDLYLASNSVSLSKINLDDEPEPEPIPKAVPMPLLSAAMAHKLINPKYSLVSNINNNSGTLSDNRSKKSISNNPMKVIKRSKELPQAPPIHPGLLNLEKANMIYYLPTWPEPDPPSDVIGFINIRDSNKPWQAHLMRSELGTSQAIRFKDPFCLPEKPLPEKACPRPRPETPSAHSSSEQVSRADLQPSQPQKSQEEPARHTKALDPTHDPENSQGNVPILPPPIPKPRTVHLVIGNKDDKGESKVFVVGKPKMDSETILIQKKLIPSQIPASLDSHSPLVTKSTSSSSAEPCKEHETMTAPLHPKRPAMRSSSFPGTRLPPSVIDSETTLVKPHCDGKTKCEEGRATVRENQKQRVEMGVDVNQADSVDWSCAQTPNNDSNFSSTSEEYFECSESVNVESRYEVRVNGMYFGSEHSEHNWFPGEENTTAKDSQSSVKLKPENQQKKTKEKETENPPVQEPNIQHIEEVKEAEVLSVLEKSDKMDVNDASQLRPEELGPTLHLALESTDKERSRKEEEKAYQEPTKEIEADLQSVLQEPDHQLAMVEKDFNHTDLEGKDIACDLVLENKPDGQSTKEEGNVYQQLTREIEAELQSVLGKESDNQKVMGGKDNHTRLEDEGAALYRVLESKPDIYSTEEGEADLQSVLDLDHEQVMVKDLNHSRPEERRDVAYLLLESKAGVQPRKEEEKAYQEPTKEIEDEVLLILEDSDYQRTMMEKDFNHTDLEGKDIACDLVLENKPDGQSTKEEGNVYQQLTREIEAELQSVLGKESDNQKVMGGKDNHTRLEDEGAALYRVLESKPDIYSTEEGEADLQSVLDLDHEQVMVKDLNHSRPEERRDAAYLLLESKAGVQSIEEEEKVHQQPTQEIEDEVLLILEDSDYQRTMKGKDLNHSILEGKGAAHHLVFESKVDGLSTKDEGKSYSQPTQEIAHTQLIKDNMDADLHPASEKEACLQTALDKGKPQLELIYTSKEKKHQLPARPKVEGERRTPKRAALRPPIRMQPESRGGGPTRVAITKPDGIRPCKPPGPNCHSSPPTQPRAQPDRTKASQTSQPGSRQRPAATPAADSRAAFAISFPRLSQLRNLKERITGTPLGTQKKTSQGDKRARE